MENNILLAVFVLLAATVALVPLAKAAGLGTVLGYLAAGVLIGPYGLKLVSDSETIRHVSEFGVVMMLFLIGLELQPRELWRMRRSILGLGLTQLVGTALVIGGGVVLMGFGWRAGIIIGLTMAMSSTAIAMQSVAQRSITKSPTGRATLAVLLVQDVAVIPILAAIPLLATSGPAIDVAAQEAVEAIANPIDWGITLSLVAAFIATILAGRYLIRPVMRFVAETGVREAFTALGLALVIGAALAVQAVGLSPALGAFMGGVLLADSEYRHELESDLEPFKGLLLGLFFISVGMSIAFSVVVTQPLMVVGLVVALVAIKIAVLFGITSAFRMPPSERLMVSLLLSQAGEFGFVILQFAGNVGGLHGEMVQILTVVVALSMATTPFLILAFDKLMAPRLADDPSRHAEELPGTHKVIVLGYGRFGQIVTRMLRAQGFEMTLIDDDPTQIALVKRFGVKVFYGDGSRLDILRAAGAAQADLIVIAVAGRERILAIAELIRRHFPNVAIAARAVDRSHAHDLIQAGVPVFERETFRSAVALGAKALVSLGYSESRAGHLAAAFERHDIDLLEQSYELRHDQDAYVGFIRRSSELLDAVMQADKARADATDKASWLGDIDADDDAETDGKPPESEPRPKP